MENTDEFRRFKSAIRMAREASIKEAWDIAKAALENAIEITNKFGANHTQEQLCIIRTLIKNGYTWEATRNLCSYIKALDDIALMFGKAE